MAWQVDTNERDAVSAQSGRSIRPREPDLTPSEIIATDRIFKRPVSMSGAISQDRERFIFFSA